MKALLLVSSWEARGRSKGFWGTLKVRVLEGTGGGLLGLMQPRVCHGGIHGVLDSHPQDCLEEAWSRAILLLRPWKSCWLGCGPCLAALGQQKLLLRPS